MSAATVLRRLGRRLVVAGSALALVAVGLAIPASPAVAADPAYQVLVFSKTAGFRHGSIPVGIQAIRDLGAANAFTVTATEDAGQFTTGNLARFRAVVFLSTTGDVLNGAQQAAFESYVNGGGGYVGIHAAADTEYGWSFYGQLVGAYFSSHPAVQQATITVEDRGHAATAHLGTTWTRTDEWYDFRANPRANVRVLASLNESSYSGGSMGDHPIAWCHPQGSGRAFYTGLGHTDSSYGEPAFRAHLLGAIRYAAGWAPASCLPASAGQTVEGEAWSSQSGVQVANHGGASGGRTVGYVDNGDWTAYAQASTGGRTRFGARVSSGGAGGTIQVRSGSSTGALLGSVAVPRTGSWDTFTTVTGNLTGSASGPTVLVYVGGGGSLFDVDTFTLS